VNGSSRELAKSGISVKTRVGRLHTNIEVFCHSAAGLVLLQYPVKTRREELVLARFLILSVAHK
jgi:hypothetical protein